MKEQITNLISEYQKRNNSVDYPAEFFDLESFKRIVHEFYSN